MDKFEYKVERKDEDDFSMGYSTEEVYLNRMGQNGWEMTGLYHVAIGLSHPTYYYFKRKLNQQNEEVNHSAASKLNLGFMHETKD